MERLVKTKDESLNAVLSLKFSHKAHSCSCFETAARGLGGVAIVEIGRLFLRFSNWEGEKIFSSLRRNPKRDVDSVKIN